MGNKTFKSASNGRQHQVSETISEDEYVRQEEEEDAAAEFDLVASLLDRNMDHAVLEIFNNLDFSSLLRCRWTSSRWREFVLDNLERLDFGAKEERHNLLVLGPVTRALSPADFFRYVDVGALRSMDGSEVDALEVKPPRCPQEERWDMWEGSLLFNEKYFLHLDWDMYDTYEGTDACFISGFLFQDRHHQNDSSSANDGPPFRGAPKGITLNRFPIKDRAQYRDTIFTESSEMFRMCPDSAEMREVGPISSFLRGRRVVDATGLDGLLLVSGEYDGSAGWMTMLDWDREEILWDSPTDRKDQWEQVRATLLGASCVAKVYAREMAFRLCLFSKRSGAPLAEEQVGFGSCTPVTSSICGDTVAVLCVEEERALTCHLYSCDERGGGGVASKRIVCLRGHSASWERGAQMGSLECELRCGGSAMVILLGRFCFGADDIGTGARMYLWDLRGGVSSLASEEELEEGLRFAARTRDGERWVFWGEGSGSVSMGWSRPSLHARCWAEMNN